MSALSYKIVVKSYIPFSFLTWDAEFHLVGNTDDVPNVYKPVHYASQEDFLSNQAMQFGSWLWDAVNGLRIKNHGGEVMVYDQNGNIIWEKKSPLKQGISTFS